MNIKISNLSDGIHNYKFEEAVSELGLEEPFIENLLVDAELKKSHNQVILDTKLSIKTSFNCDRCNKNFNTVLTSSYRMVYMFGTEPVDSGSINITYLSLETDKISIDNDVRDYALLSIPMKKLCKEDCKGLCTKCGKDLNDGDCGCQRNEIDNRWLPLLELKNKINTN